MAKKQRRVEEDMEIRSLRTVPDVSVDFVVTEVGYQMDLYLDTGRNEESTIRGGGLTCIEIECRDFGGTPGPKKAIESLINHLREAVDKWRSKL